jgi:NTP pyrophosphatase (non-canonical NTP hydrolase)
MNFKEYQDSALELALVSETVNGIPAWIYFALGMSGETGEVSEKIKKTLRDENAILTDEKKREILKEIGDVIWYAAALSRELGFSLEEAAQANLDKLISRRERGVLRGSGDNR